jgi:hypothetical protein
MNGCNKESVGLSVKVKPMFAAHHGTGNGIDGVHLKRETDKYFVKNV